jgi:hypothetical protein
MTAMVPDAAPAPRRSRFDGLKLSASAERTPAGSGRGLGVANQRYARAVQDIGRMIEQGLPALEYQKIAEVQAARALDAMRQNGASDLDAVFAREPGLVSEAAKGRTANAIRQMQLETELRTNPELRAALSRRGNQLLGREWSPQWSPGSRGGGIGAAIGDQARTRSVIQQLTFSIERGRNLGIGL